MIIAIDGPAGSGKSTVSKTVAKRLGILYVDTGAMYRALTLKAIRKGYGFEDEKALVKLAAETEINLKASGDTLKVFLDGEDVGGQIRTAELTNVVRYIARVPGVRARMVELQRGVCAESDAVLEGRDIGTIVFPNAEFKFYLDADPKERANRRLKDLVATGHKMTLEEVEKNVKIRDKGDMTREAGPLKRAEDAIIIDTTRLTADEVAEKVLKTIDEAKK